MDNNITKVWLLNVPLERDYQHTLYFEAEAHQNNYFLSKQIRSFTDFSYQKKEGVIRIPVGYDDAIKANYVAYQNAAFSNKWFYAFITDYEYKGSDQTNITIETDVIQTWMFDFTILPSFVEREHVKSDAIGEHILEEGLQIGDYVTNTHEKAGYGRSLYVVIGVSKVYANLKAENGVWQFIAELTGIDEGWAQVVGGKYHGLFSGLAYRAFKYDDEKQMESLVKLIQFYDVEGHGEDIQVMFLAPAELIKIVGAPEGLHSKDSFGGWIENSSDVDVQFINKVDENDNSVIQMGSPHIDGYLPRNNKLMNYPYRYLLIANNNGVAVPFKYEDFYAGNSVNGVINDPSFRIEGCLCPGCSIRLVPIDYKGALRNDEEGINLGKYPSLNWTSDLYTNWVTQNAVNVGIDIMSSIASAAIGVAGVVAAPATGGLSTLATVHAAGAIAGGVSGVARTMGEVHKASFSPAQSKGNVNSGDVIAISGQNDIHFYGMSIKSAYAKILDDYFDMYGYKVNDVKTPNMRHRENWWYTKTIDVNITGQIPQIDLAKIKACYNAGITFWRIPSTLDDSGVKNYGRTNNITIN